MTTNTEVQQGGALPQDERAAFQQWLVAHGNSPDIAHHREEWEGFKAGIIFAQRAAPTAILPKLKPTASEVLEFARQRGFGYALESHQICGLVDDVLELLAQRAASVPAHAASEIERGVAERDAALFGTGYLVGGKRVAPEWVTVVRAAPVPAASVPDAEALMSKLPELRELAHSVLGNCYLGQEREKELAELLLAAAPQTTEKK